MADGCDGSCKDGVIEKEESIDEKELERLAVESILLDARRGKLRSESFGPSGWQRCHIPRTNKRFLNTLVAEAVSTNKRMKIQQLQREKQNTECQTDISDAVNGRKKSGKVAQTEPPSKKDGMISSEHGICGQQKGPSPSETNPTVENSDEEEEIDGV